MSATLEAIDRMKGSMIEPFKWEDAAKGVYTRFETDEGNTLKVEEGITVSDEEAFAIQKLFANPELQRYGRIEHAYVKLNYGRKHLWLVINYSERVGKGMPQLIQEILETLVAPGETEFDRISICPRDAGNPFYQKMVYYNVRTNDLQEL